MDREWTVLLIGGASGTGKSSLAYAIANSYGVNVLEVDDIHLAIEKVTTKEQFPAIHYFDEGLDWKTIGIHKNVDWLISVSEEMIPILSELIERHLKDQVPVIIEGDFLSPKLALELKKPGVKAVFLEENIEDQIIRNYLNREGGDPQEFRAKVSMAYGERIKDFCSKNHLESMEARPYETVLERTLQRIK